MNPQNPCPRCGRSGVGRADVTSGRQCPLSAIVKVCGCRPHDGGAAHTGAGVRKPPREETAGGARGWRDVGYGDLSATDEVGEWSRGAPASLWTVKRLLDERRVASNS